MSHPKKLVASWDAICLKVGLHATSFRVDTARGFPVRHKTDNDCNKIAPALITIPNPSSQGALLFFVKNGLYVDESRTGEVEIHPGTGKFLSEHRHIEFVGIVARFSTLKPPAPMS